MKILFLIGAVLSAVLLTLPPFLNQCLAPEHPPASQTAAHTEAAAVTETVIPPAPETEPDTAAAAPLSDAAVTETAALTVGERACPAPAAAAESVSTAASAPTGTAAAPADVSPTAEPGYDSGIRICVTGEERTYTASLREYLIGVVMAEMPSYFHREALRAQAVAARTYLLYRVDRGYRIYDYGSSCTAHFSEAEGRAFFGDVYDSVLDTVTAAVDDTDGEVLYYEGEYCCAAYHAMSYSTTADAADVWGGDTPYLIPVTTPETASLAGLTTEVTYDEAALCRLLGVSAALPFSVSYTDAGRIAAVTAASGDTVSGETFRSQLRLRSTAVTLTQKDTDTVRLCVRGYGHGVGMSQYGADIYADAGWSYKRILSHYYPGTSLGLVP